MAENNDSDDLTRMLLGSEQIDHERLHDEGIRFTSCLNAFQAQAIIFSQVGTCRPEVSLELLRTMEERAGDLLAAVTRLRMVAQVAEPHPSE